MNKHITTGETDARKGIGDRAVGEQRSDDGEKSDDQAVAEIGPEIDAQARPGGA